MTSIIPFLFLIVLIPIFFLALSQRTELSEEQRQAQRKMMICTAVWLTITLSLLSIVPMLPIGQAERTFLITILLIPLTIPLLCCHYWIHRYRYKNSVTNAKREIALSIVVIGISFIIVVLVAFWGYNKQVNMLRNLPERLPPAVPFPVDFAPPIAAPASETP